MLAVNTLFSQNHPNLILTKAGVENIRNSDEKAPLFEQVLEATKKEVDADIESGIHVPIPKDMAGGYTHERHKKNFFILQKAGSLYQITGDEKYAIFIRDVFLEYAKMYPTLPIHPTDRSYATGKIFWQCLNDANWLVYCRLLHATLSVLLAHMVQPASNTISSSEFWDMSVSRSFLILTTRNSTLE